MKLPMMPPAETVAELFRTHAAAMALYACQWLDRSSADDVVQKVFVSLIRGNQLPREPRAWLFHCVRNAAMSMRRSDRRRDLRESCSAARDWFEPKIEDALIAREVSAALESLEKFQREVVVLKIWSGLTFAEISRITAVPVSTAHDHYRAALKILHKKLE